MSFTSSETLRFPRPSELQRYPSTLMTHTLNHPKRGIPVQTNTKKSGQRMYDPSRPNLCRPRHFGQGLQLAVIPGLISCIMVSRSTWTQQFQHMDLEDEYKKGSVRWAPTMQKRSPNNYGLRSASIVLALTGLSISLLSDTRGKMYQDSVGQEHTVDHINNSI